MHPDRLEFRFEGNVKFRGLEVDEQLLRIPPTMGILFDGLTPLIRTLI